jgi:enoyl-CoA hydratase
VEDILETVRDDGVATVTLNRPAVRNALSKDLRQAIRSTIAELDADDTVGAIVLTGAGSAFCAGVDTRELGADASADIRPLTAPFVSSATPLIGAINGAAYTGGLELALACHFLVASDRATFADTHTRLHLMPGWGVSVLLTDAVGSRRAREMSLSSAPVDAGTALQWGLVNHVVAHEDLLPFTLGIARQIAAHGPAAVRRASRLYDAQAAVRTAAAWQLEATSWVGTEPPRD